MNTSSKFAIAAIILSAFASPVFAEQRGVGADPITDGRYAPPVNHVKGFHTTDSWSAPRGAGSAEMAQIDRLAQGRL